MIGFLHEPIPRIPGPSPVADLDRMITPKNAGETVTDPPPSALRLMVWTFTRVLVEWMIWIFEAWAYAGP